MNSNVSELIFNTKQQEELLSAIRSAEKNTSGEIRIHVESSCKGEVLDRASQIFAQLKMHKTKLRNGVLFYLAWKDHKFAILGDQGINVKVPPDFWEKCKQILSENFKENNFCEGLCKGISMAGFQLKEHFPYQSDDINELPDDISYGK